MTATTSKLGADMTDEQIESARGAADKECPLGPVNVRWYRAFARALLARQPAAIDKQEALDPEQHGLPPYPKGNVVGPCVCGSWPGGECLKCRVIPAAPSVEQDERGAFEAEWKRSGWGDADTKNQCFHFWQARAASTSANGAQGAEAVQFVFPPMPQAIVMHEKLGPLFDRLSMQFYADKCICIAAPPAQTALTVTRAMVKAAIPWLTGLHHMRNTDAKAHIEEAIKAALTAAQSASGDTQ